MLKKKGHNQKHVTRNSNKTQQNHIMLCKCSEAKCMNWMTGECDILLNRLYTNSYSYESLHGMTEPTTINVVDVPTSYLINNKHALALKSSMWFTLVNTTNCTYINILDNVTWTTCNSLQAVKSTKNTTWNTAPHIMRCLQQIREYEPQRKWIRITHSNQLLDSRKSWKYQICERLEKWNVVIFQLTDVWS